MLMSISKEKKQFMTCAIVGLQICIVLVLLKKLFESKTPKSMPMPVSKPMPTNTKILLYGRTSCPYTVKAVEQLKKDNIWDKVRFIDTDTEAGSAEFSKKKVNGVPYFENPSNGKSAIGFSPDSRVLMQKLGA